MSKITLRDYQLNAVEEGIEKLNKLGLLYINYECRLGKTLISLEILNRLNIKEALFVTKKKAIKSVENDYNLLNPEYNITVINYESVVKVATGTYDIIVIDEAHSIGKFAKASKRTRDLKKIIDKQHCKVVFLSATPTPESYSQIYHQFYVSSRYSPFKEWGSFYKWAKEFVDVQKKHIAHGNIVNDYSKADKKKVMKYIEPYFITYTQEEAGFVNKVIEKVHYVDMMPNTYVLCDKLKKDLVLEGKNEVILADTGVKLQSKLHQMYSGTVKFESGNKLILDKSKAHYILDNFKNKKIAIFYVFQAEFELLKEVFPKFTTSPEEFNDNNDLVYLGQVRSSREGVNLSTADDLIMYNIEFSALSYLQGKDRMTSKGRTKDNNVHWIFSKKGIEQKIYNTVMGKKDYSLSYFCKDFGIDKKIFKKR